MFDVTANYHRGNPQSRAAHDSIVSSKDQQRGRIMALLKLRPAGLTCDEAEVLLGMRHQSCSARFSELKRDGLIAPDGTRATRSGRFAAIYKPAA